jgi:hypothetical protein
VVVASLARQRTSRLDVGSGLTDELAAIATSMEQLQALVRRGDEISIPVRISSHLSADPLADLATLLEAVTPQAVVVAASDEVALALADIVDVALLTVARPDDALDQADGFSVTWSPGEDHDLAVAVACRAAAFTGLPVHVEAAPGASERRFSGLVRGLSERGVALAEMRPDGAVRIGGHAPADIVVRAERDAVPIDWDSVDLGAAAARQPG